MSRKSNRRNNNCQSVQPVVNDWYMNVISEIDREEEQARQAETLRRQQAAQKAITQQNAQLQKVIAQQAAELKALKAEKAARQARRDEFKVQVKAVAIPVLTGAAFLVFSLNLAISLL